MDLIQELDDDLLSRLLSQNLLDLDNPPPNDTELETLIAFAVELAANVPPGPLATSISGRFVSPAERRTLLEESEGSDDNDDDDDDDDDDGDGDEDAPLAEGGCTVCVKRRGPKLQLPCGDWFCPHCIRTAVRLACTNEESFPLRCHEPFTEEVVCWGAAPTGEYDLVFLWRQCRREWSTPPNIRLYCSNRECGAFVPRDARLMVGGGGLGGDREGWGERIVQCPVCEVRTCLECRAEAHPGTLCWEGASSDRDEEEFWTFLDENGWCPCDVCGRTIMLRDGCNHVTCHCGYDFCFLCSEQWNSCDCPLYSGAEWRLPMRTRRIPWAKLHLRARLDRQRAAAAEARQDKNQDEPAHPPEPAIAEVQAQVLPVPRRRDREQIPEQRQPSQRVQNDGDEEYDDEDLQLGAPEPFPEHPQALRLGRQPNPYPPFNIEDYRHIIPHNREDYAVPAPNLHGLAHARAISSLDRRCVREEIEERSFSARIGDEQRRWLTDRHSHEMSERRIVESWFQARASGRLAFMDLANPASELMTRNRREQEWNGDMQARRRRALPAAQLEPLEGMELPVLESTPLWVLPDELRHGRALEDMVDGLQRRYHDEMDGYDAFKREHPLTEPTSDPVVLMMRDWHEEQNRRRNLFLDFLRPYVKAAGGHFLMEMFLRSRRGLGESKPGITMMQAWEDWGVGF